MFQWQDFCLQSGLSNKLIYCCGSAMAMPWPFGPACRAAQWFGKATHALGPKPCLNPILFLTSMKNKQPRNINTLKVRTCIDFFPFEEAILQEVSSMSTENLLRSLLPIGLASAFDFGVLRNICKARLTNEPSIINSSWHNFISVRWVWLLLGADSQKWHKFLRAPFIREAEIIVVGRTAWGHSNAMVGRRTSWQHVLHTTEQVTNTEFLLPQLRNTNYTSLPDNEQPKQCL